MIYTIQEYAHASNVWATWIGALRYGDCNGNNVDDEEDLAGGTSLDLNGTGKPDECEVVSPGAVEFFKKNRYISFTPEKEM